MKISRLTIRNFKSIRELTIENIENALILVGKNNTGKTVVADAVRAVTGNYKVKEIDFNNIEEDIEILMTLEITEEDLHQLHIHGIVSCRNEFEDWIEEFKEMLPSYENDRMDFTCIIQRNKEIRYADTKMEHNPHIKEVLPKLYYIGTNRDLKQFQDDMLMFQESAQLSKMRSQECLLNPAKNCDRCFSCIEDIKKKKADSLEIYETARLLEHKMYQLNLQDFSQRVNENYRMNGGLEEINYTVSCNMEQLFHINVEARHKEHSLVRPVEKLGNGMRSIYMLSLLETYVEDEKQIPSIIIVEYPEMFLHPSLQKNAGKILYHLSKKNQVMFTTHSPNMLANFTRGQLCQIVTDQDGYSVARPNADIDEVLNDLGYTANDLLNVDFVFIVEGKQDKSRLPLLLERYYPEIRDKEGNLSRISIITTNSCTNIKTYANLKYMNQVYLKDQFLMIRDGDGKDPEELANQLCRYYSERQKQEIDRLPRVRRENVLILKYYSFENYFLNPKVMAELGIVKDEEDFWKTLLIKWKKYLWKLSSGKKLVKAIGKRIYTTQDLKENFEAFKIHMRGHNVYDIFYGRYRNNETELLKQYLELAPREDFADILDTIDKITFFESKK
ncbi:MAG: OLD family endonuclease [Lachnospiraceae bacterium]|nr:OLD family endonuclease [Lachnospiraceae bacterium]